MKYLAALILSGSLLACRSGGNSSSVKEFEPTPKADEVEEIKDFKLASVADIPQKVTRAVPEFDPDEAASDDQFDPWGPEYVVWNVEFGRIKEAEFQRLQATYYKNPRLIYDPKRKYQIIDFMPPQIQAMAGLRFKSESLDTDIPSVPGKSGKKPRVSLETFSNCWNAAYEIVRASETDSSIYYLDEAVVRSVFTDPKRSELLSSLPLTASEVERNAGRKPFDLLMVYNDQELIHVAVYLDKDFYFEKTGPDSRLNYRFVGFQDIEKVYSTWRKPRIEFRRFLPQTLPPANEVFSMKAQGTNFPDGFITEEYLKSHPDFLSQVSYWSPRNWKDTDYRNIYRFVTAKLQYNEKLQRFEMSRDAFKPLLKN